MTNYEIIQKSDDLLYVNLDAEAYLDFEIPGLYMGFVDDSV